MSQSQILLDSYCEVDVDGVTYRGKKSVEVRGNNVFVDGVKADTKKGETRPLDLIINGNVSGTVSASGTVRVSGDVNGDVKSTFGNIEVEGSARNVTTMSGTIECCDVSGSIISTNGSIHAGYVQGNVQTTNGNITYKKKRDTLASDDASADYQVFSATKLIRSSYPPPNHQADRGDIRQRGFISSSL